MPAHFSLAAKGPADSRVAHRIWRSPDGQLRAVLAIDLADQKVESVCINFETDDSPATHLDQTPVWLAGQQATIQSNGNAAFSLAKLP